MRVTLFLLLLIAVMGCSNSKKSDEKPADSLRTSSDSLDQKHADSLAESFYEVSGDTLLKFYERFYKRLDDSLLRLDIPYGEDQKTLIKELNYSRRLSTIYSAWADTLLNKGTTLIEGSSSTEDCFQSIVLQEYKEYKFLKRMYYCGISEGGESGWIDEENIEWYFFKNDSLFAWHKVHINNPTKGQIYEEMILEFINGSIVKNQKEIADIIFEIPPKSEIDYSNIKDSTDNVPFRTTMMKGAGHDVVLQNIEGSKQNSELYSSDRNLKEFPAGVSLLRNLVILNQDINKVTQIPIDLRSLN